MLGVPVTHWFWLIFAAEVFQNYFFLEARPEIPCPVNKVKVSLLLQPLLLLFWKLLKGYTLLIISNLTKTWRLVLAGRFQTRVQHSPETSWQKHLTSLLEYLCCCSLLRNNTLCFGDGGGAELYPATGWSESVLLLSNFLWHGFVAPPTDEVNIWTFLDDSHSQRGLL